MPVPSTPFWGGLADRKGRKLMLLRSALGMGIVMVLMGLAPVSYTHLDYGPLARNTRPGQLHRFI